MDALSTENARLRALVSKLDTSRRRHQIRANDAAKRIDTAERRLEAVQVEVAERVRAARETEARARSRVQELTAELVPHKERAAEYEEAITNLDKAEFYISNYDTQVQKQMNAITTERRQMAKILRDWDYLARRYFNQRTPEMYTEHDYSILKTWQARNRQRPTTQKKNTRSLRRTR